MEMFIHVRVCCHLTISINITPKIPVFKGKCNFIRAIRGIGQ
ncbi:hypothetical protein MtrunA17_Chr7g0237891 [Medicago truncatula]|uniref:Uncharacterized protein n=1 Tax=Medicago truncatula TaxID=3880 RepID=A0A396H4I8_MEDTR|nr:hypothetical protein MtrunA17_Chr7g0237891 [Medicago truncatula]